MFLLSFVNTLGILNELPVDALFACIAYLVEIRGFQTKKAKNLNEIKATTLQMFPSISALFLSVT